MYRRTRFSRGSAVNSQGFSVPSWRNRVTPVGLAPAGSWSKRLLAPIGPLYRKLQRNSSLSSRSGSLVEHANGNRYIGRGKNSLRDRIHLSAADLSEEDPLPTVQSPGAASHHVLGVLQAECLQVRCPRLPGRACSAHPAEANPADPATPCEDWAGAAGT